MKDIVIIAEFCGDFSPSDNCRFLQVARMLTKDNKVEIVTSSFYHQSKKKRSSREYDYGFRITLIDEPGYPKNVCLRRFYSHYKWGIRVYKYLASRSNKPDLIYCAVPSLTGPKCVSRFCEKNDIPFIIDIQDLWPEAFQMVIEIPVVSDVLFAPFVLIANLIYRQANEICAVSDTYVKRALLTNTKCKKGTTVFLGTELDTFDRYAEQLPILEKSEDEIWIAYCGTLGSSYDITCVMDALEIIHDNRVWFIVMGDGPKKYEFMAYAKKKQIQAIFTGMLSYDKMCSLLNICDITVNPITHKAAQSIINKHADYAASGLPVVNTQENREYRDLVKEYQMGFNCNNNDAVDMSRRIRQLIDNIDLRIKMGKNARRCAEEKFDRKNTYKKIVDLIEEYL